jgi:hypothetical protein
VRFHVCRFDHLPVGGTYIPRKFPEQVFPDATPYPLNKTIVDCHLWAVFKQAIAPPARAFQLVYDAADDAAIILSFDTKRVDPLPTLIAWPKQVLRIIPIPEKDESVRMACPSLGGSR